MNDQRRPRHRSRNRPPRDRPDQQIPAVSEALRRVVSHDLKVGPYVVFDIETTGGNPEKNGITEIFAIKYENGEPGETFYSLVNPRIPIPPIVRRMTGINDRMVKNAPLIQEVMPRFVEFAGDSILVSHNTIGDMKFLRYFGLATTQKEMANFYLCTHLLVEKLLPDAPDKSLSGVAKQLGLYTGDVHRAEGDGRITLELFKILQSKLIEQAGLETIEEGIRLQNDMESSIRLGWRVPDGDLAQLSSQTGVVELLDLKGKPLIIAAATDMRREGQKFRDHSQIPKHLLRLVLRGGRVTGAPSRHFFAALMDEAQRASDVALPFPPVEWHQRSMYSLTIKQDEFGIRVAMEHPAAGDLHIFGPIRDRKETGQFLAALAKVWNAPSTKRGVLLPKESLRPLLSLLRGTLREDIVKELRARFSVGAVFKLITGRRDKGYLSGLRQMTGLKVPGGIESQLDKTGLLAVPFPRGEDWDLYGIVCGRPIHLATLTGPWWDQLEKTELMHVHGPALRALIQQKKHKPLDPIEVNQVNAALWWLSTAHVRKQQSFLPIAHFI